MEEAAECMLVLIGATPEGKKELVGFQTGVREGAQSWRELLIDIKKRGLEIVQVNMKVDLREIYAAPTRAAAEAAIDVFADKYNAKHDKAVACLTKDRETLLRSGANKRNMTKSTSPFDLQRLLN
jgi:putative transposase